MFEIVDLKYAFKINIKYRLILWIVDITLFYVKIQEQSTKADFSTKDSNTTIRDYVISYKYDRVFVVAMSIMSGSLNFE